MHYAWKGPIGLCALFTSTASTVLFLHNIFPRVVGLWFHKISTSPKSYIFRDLPVYVLSRSILWNSFKNHRCEWEITKMSLILQTQVPFLAISSYWLTYRIMEYCLKSKMSIRNLLHHMVDTMNQIILICLRMMAFSGFQMQCMIIINI